MGSIAGKGVADGDGLPREAKGSFEKVLCSSGSDEGVGAGDVSDAAVRIGKCKSTLPITGRNKLSKMEEGRIK
ncbi:MAG: hypothetical protein A3F67_07315 [Verrucomicrobia bacterium RIFCSPHIGHO2_12_FULL_41_10]|nr:MAG: hypothetical protein A3F67_07315 [Verrucomicrobia bacterium RIFCSPHIGHO2_12_FULL_41_10]HLB33733.1 hypothetical protein [Chthoniobacterales bacterium]